MNYNVHLLDNVVEAAADGGSKKIAVRDGAVLSEYFQSLDATEIRHQDSLPGRTLQ